ncbi:MAG: M20/M25/M40 family metallo-hydrolase, partial [Gammaproteobacteria bacterium]|nr:M20/M25/M40 family metallo-hydrolase [Gammaproteobacteria bacterium]
MDAAKAEKFITGLWDDSILPELIEYIKIPNKSPNFDPDWEKHGYMDQAVEHAMRWVNEQDVAGMKAEVVKMDGFTPLIFIEIEGSGEGAAKDDTILLYGHLDKQPEFTGWEEGLGPWKPVVRDDKLYGRGGADDGYAIYASLAAIMALQKQGLPHSRCVLVIECCEESNSMGLTEYIEHLKDRIGEPSLVVCLDAGCGNYEQLWVTTSLRGNIVGNLRADVLTEGVHSGMASGIGASSFRVIRELLDRLEDTETGEIKVPELHVEIPEHRKAEARHAAEVMGDGADQGLPFVDGMQPMSSDPYELTLNNTWRPMLAVTGQEGMPELGMAGNTLRPYTTLKLSFRLPPTVDAPKAAAALEKAIAAKPALYGAKADFKADSAASGWDAPAVAPWLDQSMNAASNEYFGKDVVYFGMGGS